MLKNTAHFFDRLEDKIRHWLSHRPILYAFIGGTGVILFWRGVWHTADYLTNRYLIGFSGNIDTSINLSFPSWLDGVFSLILGSLLLLLTGLMVSSFIGTEILISGLRGEKKEEEKTQKELMDEIDATKRIEDNIKSISKKLDDIERRLS